VHDAIVVDHPTLLLLLLLLLILAFHPTAFTPSSHSLWCCSSSFVQSADMNHELQSEAIDLIVSAIDKQRGNYEVRQQRPSATMPATHAAAHANMDGHRSWRTADSTNRTSAHARLHAPRHDRGPLVHMSTSYPSLLVVVASQAAARSVKEQMDRKFGPSWHCIIGEGFGFQCTYQTKHMIFLYYQGNVAILLFKC
jgi:hypothetical protein